MVQVNIETKQGANRLGFEYPFATFTDLTDELKAVGGEKERELAIINKLLAAQREHALDHERGGVQFHGAAMVKTRKGRYLLQANMHLHNTDISRNCAEANAITEARGHEGKDLQITDLWFMGGRANFEEGQPFLGNIGQRVPPCGSCLDVIYNNRTRMGPETLVHMLPLNDGTMHLTLGDPDDKKGITEIKENAVFTRKIRDLLPHVSLTMEDHHGERKSMMSNGYKWIHDHDSLHAISRAAQFENLIKLNALEGHNPDLRMMEINKILMDTAKDYFQDAEVKPKSVTIAIVRASDGNYYMGKHLNNGSTPSTPSAEFSALNEMVKSSPNKRMTDIFLVSLDQKEFDTLNDYDGRHDDIPVKMPDGATRELLKKFSPQNGEAAKTLEFFNKAMDQSGANVHIFLPNNPSSLEFNPHKHVITMTVKDLLPYAFQAPKGAEFNTPSRN